MRLSLIAANLALGLALSCAGASTAASPGAETCGEYGTSIRFQESPTAAAKLAKSNGKLVLVLHVSGHFEDPTLT